MKYTKLDNIYSPTHSWLEKPERPAEERAWIILFCVGAFFVTLAFYSLRP